MVAVAATGRVATEVEEVAGEAEGVAEARMVAVVTAQAAAAKGGVGARGVGAAASHCISTRLRDRSKLRMKWSPISA